MRAPQPLHATPHGCGLIAVLLFVLGALLTGCAPRQPNAIHVSEAQVAIMRNCWANGWNARIDYDGRVAEVVCTAP